MKLDRNINTNGKGKYALINLRTNKVEWGITAEDEFFVIKLKDRHSKPALLAYAYSIESHHREFAREVYDLAARAGKDNPFCKEPD